MWIPANINRRSIHCLLSIRFIGKLCGEKRALEWFLFDGGWGSSLEAGDSSCIYMRRRMVRWHIIQMHLSLLFLWWSIAAQLFFSYLVDREVGTVAMGANPLAVTAEMANSKAELSFIVCLFYFTNNTMSIISSLPIQYTWYLKPEHWLNIFQFDCIEINERESTKIWSFNLHEQRTKSHFFRATCNFGGEMTDFFDPSFLLKPPTSLAWRVRHDEC